MKGNGKRLSLKTIIAYIYAASVFSLSRGREGFLRYMHGHLHNLQVINKCPTEQKEHQTMTSTSDILRLKEVFNH